MKFKFRILLSVACVVLSCILTVIYLSICDGNDIFTSNSVLALVRTSSVADDFVVREVDSNDKSSSNDGSDSNNSNSTKDDDKGKEVVDVPSVSIDEAVLEDKVYDDMTLDELASKLDRFLKNELSGKGYLYASYSLEKGVDPYLAVAISLEETGCNDNCSNLLKSCNNVGGMKGSGCGEYGYFDSLDDGIKAFIDNISNNYVAYGLTTADLMNSKYAANPLWASNVNNYISIIKGS